MGNLNPCLTECLNTLRLSVIGGFKLSADAARRVNEMVADDEDLPAAYLYFAIAAIIVIAITAVGAFVILIRN